MQLSDQHTKFSDPNRCFVEKENKNKNLNCLNYNATFSIIKTSK